MGKSELCTGYGIGPYCVACCVVDNMYGHGLFEVSFDINFRSGKRRASESNGKNYFQNKETFYKMLKETTERFRKDKKDGKAEKIAECFRKIDRTRVAIKELPEPSKEGFEFIGEYLQNTGFLGILENGRVGCLLYTLADSKGNSFRHKQCSDYICDLGEIVEANPHLHAVMEQFIAENMPLLDSFSYSRMIHVLSHHLSAHVDAGIDLNILRDKSRHSETKEQLKSSLELVTTTEQNIGDSIEQAIWKIKSVKCRDALRVYNLNFGTCDSVSLDFAARAFGLEPHELVGFMLFQN